MNSKHIKGLLELCVLSLLYKKDRYGYDISEELSKSIEAADGSVYPLLRKLKDDGMLSTYLSEDSGGPPRKYYSLTKMGRDEYLGQRAEWLAMAKKVESMLEDDKQ